MFPPHLLKPTYVRTCNAEEKVPILKKKPVLCTFM